MNYNPHLNKRNEKGNSRKNAYAWKEKEEKDKRRN